MFEFIRTEYPIINLGTFVGMQCISHQAKITTMTGDDKT
jgi:hypothetical protein